MTSEVSNSVVSDETEYHEPVLAKETLKYLNVQKGEKYIDCTLGDGGHTLQILSAGGKVLGLDFNDVSINRSMERIKSFGLEENFVGIKENFKNIESVAVANGFGKVSGILYDLGYSSFQLDKGSFGLSFQQDAPLDMRLQSGLNVTASDLLQVLSEGELARLFREYGEEKHAKRFAKAIVEFRKLEKLQTTNQLVGLIVGAAPPGYEKQRLHPATRVFQALRIAVNDELGNLKNSLPDAARLLKAPEKTPEGSMKPGGRMVVISFHSLEDRVVKSFGRDAQQQLKSLLERPITPGAEEVNENRRSRSAKMRIFEKRK